MVRYNYLCRQYEPAALLEGVTSIEIAHRRAGSALMVHGNCVSIGCYAMTNRRIEEIYALSDAALGGGQEYIPRREPTKR